MLEMTLDQDWLVQDLHPALLQNGVWLQIDYNYYEGWSITEFSLACILAKTIKSARKKLALSITLFVSPVLFLKVSELMCSREKNYPWAKIE